MIENHKEHMMKAVVKAMALAVSVMLTGATIASEAAAHARLMSSDPAAQSVVASPTIITLRFNEPIEAKFTKVEIKDIRGKKQRVRPGPHSHDHNVVTAVVAAPLAPGAYSLTWRIVATDAHVMEGAFTFTVR